MSHEESWQENETLAISLTLGMAKTHIDGYLIQFRSDLDFETMPRASAYPPLALAPDDEKTVWFVVIPVLSWNTIQEVIKQATLSDEQRHRLTIGRGFKIPSNNVGMKVFPGTNETLEQGFIRVIMMLDFDYDKAAYDIVDTVRHDGTPVDAGKYPFVVATMVCWNNYQRCIEEFGLREAIRTCRPMAMAIPVTRKDVCRITPEDFQELRAAAASTVSDASLDKSPQ